MKIAEILTDSLLPPEQVNTLLKQDYCELDLSFLGFTDIYKHLSLIIPEHFTILDFGCYMAAQSAYFKNHKAYIGIDRIILKRFEFKNTKHYIKDIKDFLKENLMEYDLDETFAICSYVPDEGAKKMIREMCKNVFVFYPSDKNKRVLIKGDLNGNKN